MDIVRPFGPMPELKRGDYNENFVPFISIPNLFNEDEVSKIRNLWSQDKIAEGKVGEDKMIDHNVRKSNVIFLRPGDNDWIYDKISLACIMVNANRYKFDILGFETNLQLSNYEKGGFYGWHMDSGNKKSSVRKLSISIQLSGADEYEGGELQFLRGNSTADASKAKGTAIIFPSYIYHRVQPVISGCRKSIVGWIAGPPYR